MSEQNHLELGRVILDFPIQAYTIKSLHVHEEANAHGLSVTPFCRQRACL